MERRKDPLKDKNDLFSEIQKPKEKKENKPVLKEISSFPGERTPAKPEKIGSDRAPNSQGESEAINPFKPSRPDLKTPNIPDRGNHTPVIRKVQGGTFESFRKETSQGLGTTTGAASKPYQGIDFNSSIQKSFENGGSEGWNPFDDSGKQAGNRGTPDYRNRNTGPEYNADSESRNGNPQPNAGGGSNAGSGHSRNSESQGGNGRSFDVKRRRKLRWRSGPSEPRQRQSHKRQTKDQGRAPEATQFHKTGTCKADGFLKSVCRFRRR